jgi:uncharacterized protein YlxP (DUF503 family)
MAKRDVGCLSLDRGRHFDYGPAVPTGTVGILSIELWLPGAQSLKDKRMVVRSVKDQLTRRVGASVSEVDHHDLWQRARITIACVARVDGDAGRLLDDAERWLLGQPAFELTRRDRALVRLEDVHEELA